MIRSITNHGLGLGDRRTHSSVVFVADDDRRFQEHARMFKASTVLQGDFLGSSPDEFLHEVSENYSVDESAYLQELLELARAPRKPAT